ncbi:hypothetical protein BC939DRAFT_173211 [Gamsiella multidivaricata]|uniref:uncharacterized protein n=1 Tax=Gamsiella multidivaricata TaxID=101098 RepID=UPI00221FFCC5|nr:uncharacterized protein BC939DRAFT_173211 [Gamsiella multidivaricata]KAI7822905.1 hypothetical protein BC939DRAFT_173211 [Gamsiella multidivaricata]
MDPFISTTDRPRQDVHCRMWSLVHISIALNTTDSHTQLQDQHVKRRNCCPQHLCVRRTRIIHRTFICTRVDPYFQGNFHPATTEHRRHHHHQRHRHQHRRSIRSWSLISHQLVSGSLQTLDRLKEIACALCSILLETLLSLPFSIYLWSPCIVVLLHFFLVIVSPFAYCTFCNSVLLIDS